MNVTTPTEPERDDAVDERIDKMIEEAAGHVRFAMLVVADAVRAEAHREDVREPGVEELAQLAANLSRCLKECYEQLP